MPHPIPNTGKEADELEYLDKIEKVDSHANAVVKKRESY